MNDMLKDIWVKRLGLIASGIIIGLFVFSPFSKAKEINTLSIENKSLLIENTSLDKEYISLKDNHNTLLADTADWRELSVEQQKVALDKVKKDKIEKAKAKEEEEKKAIEEKKKVEAERIAAEQRAKEAEKPDNFIDEFKQIIIDYYLRETDTLNSFSFEDGNIKATIELGTNEIFPDEDIVANMYSGLSDELLDHEGWKVLTINYLNIGTISMNRNEKVTNEYGDYFPIAVIESRLRH